MTTPMSYENGGFKLVQALEQHIKEEGFDEVNALLAKVDIDNCTVLFRTTLIQGLAPVGKLGALDDWHGLRDRAYAAFVREGANADQIMAGMMDA